MPLEVIRNQLLVSSDRVVVLVGIWLWCWWGEGCGVCGDRVMV